MWGNSQLERVGNSGTPYYDWILCPVDKLVYEVEVVEAVPLLPRTTHSEQVERGLLHCMRRTSWEGQCGHEASDNERKEWLLSQQGPQ